MPTILESTVANFISDAMPSTFVAAKPAQRKELVDPNYFPNRELTNSWTVLVPNASSPPKALTVLVPNAPPPPKALTVLDAAISQLNKFESLSEDWDGYGAEMPRENSIADAKYFIRKLAPESIVLKPALHADGHVVLLLNAPNEYAEIEFMGHKTISYYVKRGQLQWSDEIVFDGQSLPPGLSDIGLHIT